MTRWVKRKPKIKPNNNISLFDQAQRQANEGMELSYRNAPTHWKIAARETLMGLCKNKPEFTVDEFWVELAKKGIHTGEPRALGAIIKAAARAGMIKKSGHYVASFRRHGSPIVLWISNIYKGGAG